ncbi:c-type cytochrome [Sulfuricella sp.]|uniref:c-type cytochrome n=1 Tax=Sulfuricella sp. TaxID=2099377 RepID=UPI002C8E3599|nr:c-type cytochrome [Sulfuricella sp.]HUX65430.1 c-type cytochrome [Sulfuricella sp.]
MKAILGIAAAAALLVAGQAAADDQLALAQKSGCMACHQVAVKVVGPAYKDVAKKYAADKGAVDKLTKKVIAGGKDVWGPVPMPPKGGNAAVKDEDIKKIVAWVLTLK